LPAIGCSRLARLPSSGKASWVGTSDAGLALPLPAPAGLFGTVAVDADGFAAGSLVGLAPEGITGAGFAFGLVDLAFVAGSVCGTFTVPGLIAVGDRVSAGLVGTRLELIIAAVVGSLASPPRTGGCWVGFAGGFATPVDLPFSVLGLASVGVFELAIGPAPGLVAVGDGDLAGFKGISGLDTASGPFLGLALGLLVGGFAVWDVPAGDFTLALVGLVCATV
jgi:hypothetical protein